MTRWIRVVLEYKMEELVYVQNGLHELRRVFSVELCPS